MKKILNNYLIYLLIVIAIIKRGMFRYFELPTIIYYSFYLLIFITTILAIVSFIKNLKNFKVQKMIYVIISIAFSITIFGNNIVDRYKNDMISISLDFKNLFFDSKLTSNEKSVLSEYLIGKYAGAAETERFGSGWVKLTAEATIFLDKEKLKMKLDDHFNDILDADMTPKVSTTIYEGNIEIKKKWGKNLNKEIAEKYIPTFEIYFNDLQLGTLYLSDFSFIEKKDENDFNSLISRIDYYNKNKASISVKPEDQFKWSYIHGFKFRWSSHNKDSYEIKKIENNTLSNEPKNLNVNQSDNLSTVDYTEKVKNYFYFKKDNNANDINLMLADTLINYFGKANAPKLIVLNDIYNYNEKWEITELDFQNINKENDLSYTYQIITSVTKRSSNSSILKFKIEGKIIFNQNGLINSVDEKSVKIK